MDPVNIFLDSLRDGIEIDRLHMEEVLNRNFAENNPDYQFRVDLIKSTGYKVFRNSKGEHLIKVDLT